MEQKAAIAYDLATTENENLPSPPPVITFSVIWKKELQETTKKIRERYLFSI
ncbi:hypothetical protein RchiOBHm_Chr1g0324081 [Rosa chinensis]|uniref:Uncharacterized protein n=1 Tax=Rosa chinensis TaxID=74649 RepID=A0A2P6S9M0_ROSCH|nr:hypothetical protein RchiOBHm_Chr1g0324081 [Rosa chinensis]